MPEAHGCGAGAETQILGTRSTTLREKAHATECFPLQR